MSAANRPAHTPLVEQKTTGYRSVGDRRFLLSRYRLLDVARWVVGVGSVGTCCWVAYLEGKEAYADQNDAITTIW